MGSVADAARKAIGTTDMVVSIRSDIAEAVQSAGLAASAIAEAALRAATAEMRRAAWLEENAEALAEQDAWVEKNGLPFKKYRPF